MCLQAGGAGGREAGGGSGSGQVLPGLQRVGSRLPLPTPSSSASTRETASPPSFWHPFQHPTRSPKPPPARSPAPPPSQRPPDVVCVRLKLLHLVHGVVVVHPHTHVVRAAHHPLLAGHKLGGAHCSSAGTDGGRWLLSTWQAREGTGTCVWLRLAAPAPECCLARHHRFCCRCCPCEAPVALCQNCCADLAGLWPRKT